MIPRHELLDDRLNPNELICVFGESDLQTGTSCKHVVHNSNVCDGGLSPPASIAIDRTTTTSLGWISGTTQWTERKKDSLTGLTPRSHSCHPVWARAGMSQWEHLANCAAPQEEASMTRHWGQKDFNTFYTPGDSTCFKWSRAAQKLPSPSFYSVFFHCFGLYELLSFTSLRLHAVSHDLSAIC